MRKLISYVAVFVLGGVAATAVWFAGSLLNEPSRPALLLDLPTDSSKIEAAWDTRLRERFAVGTSEVTLLAALSEAGFGFREIDGRLWAFYDTAPIVCVESYLVEWSLDDRRRISAIDGGFHLSCL